MSSSRKPPNRHRLFIKSKPTHILLEPGTNKLIKVTVPDLELTFQTSGCNCDCMCLNNTVVALPAAFIYNHETTVPEMKNFFLRCAGGSMVINIGPSDDDEAVV
ncbi:hypothetical protein FS749_007699, partial [Ceratobasidium sp. UAMH 11750]